MKNYLRNKKILITGSSGLIGSELKKKIINFSKKIYSIDSKIDLRDKNSINKTIKKIKPDIIFHLAAQVGGIWANAKYKYDFFYNNLLINTNVIDSAWRNKVEYFVGIGTGSAYPKKLENKILNEIDFLSGEPDVSNEGYAYAKRMLLIQLRILEKTKKLKYCFFLPANIYGPNDNFSINTSHVVPSLIRRFFEEKKEKKILIWGNEKTKRDFLYVGDCVDAIIYACNKKLTGMANISSGKFETIKKLVTIIKKTSGYEGKIFYENNNLVGQKIRKLSSKKLSNIGWKSKVTLLDGIKNTYQWFEKNQNNFRGKY
jgi:GDP-L-fucose synthase